MSSSVARPRPPLLEQLHEIFHATDYTERDAFHLIGCFSQSEPAIAGAFAFHLRDLIQETFDRAHEHATTLAIAEGLQQDDAIGYEVELDYSELLAMTYERTFFDAEHAVKYGTQLFTGDEQLLARCIAHLQTMVDLDEANSPNVVPIHHAKSH